MTNRQNLSSNTTWETKVGYSRAVRIGNIIEVAGTTALDGDQIIAPGDPYKQMCYILEKIEQTLSRANASLSDVVRTRMYITDMIHAEEIGRAHAKYFSKIKPASTMIQISALVEPELVVEVEMTAIISS
ncbi:MAG: RidA family protein [Calditrichaceae bacterium]